MALKNQHKQTLQTFHVLFVCLFLQGELAFLSSTVQPETVSKVFWHKLWTTNEGLIEPHPKFGLEFATSLS